MSVACGALEVGRTENKMVNDSHVANQMVDSLYERDVFSTYLAFGIVFIFEDWESFSGLRDEFRYSSLICVFKPKPQKAMTFLSQQWATALPKCSSGILF